MRYFIVLGIFIINLFANAYILDSDVNRHRYMQLHLDIWSYDKGNKDIKNILLKKGIKAEIIKEDDLEDLKPGDILFLIDSFAISKKAQNEIIKFVANGGKLVFNFKSAFLDEKGNFTRDSFLVKLTKLKPIGFGYKPGDNDIFVVQHLLSPISMPDSKVFDFVVYDTIPFFKGKTPDLEFTNFTATEPLRYKGKFVPSGALWDGKYKKGGWIYFSFPFYVMKSKLWKSVFNSIVDYSIDGIKVVKYPYLKFDKMTFVSEDTEYKYLNFNNFINALEKYDVNGTAFCVGRLAKLHPTLMKMAGKLPFLEISSHSYSHTKLIDKSKEILDKVEINGNNKLLQSLSGQEVKGFRPPREELNNKMKDVMETSSIDYILASYLRQLKPKYFGRLMLFSRMGTDDYQFLMELDWNKTQIVNKMIQESDYITSLNGMYTMSTHTHLMNYKTNVTMFEGLLKHLKEKHYPVLKGRDIANLIFTKDRIFVDSNLTKQGLDITINNKNPYDVKEFIFRVFYLTKPFTKVRCPLKTEMVKTKNNYVDIKVFNIPKKQTIKLFLETK